MASHSFWSRFVHLVWLRYFLIGLILVGLAFYVGHWWGNRYEDVIPYGKGGGGYSEMALNDSVSYDSRSISPIPPEMSRGDLSDYDTVGSKIIKNGSLSLDVKKTGTFMDQVYDLVEHYKGFVQYANTWIQSDDTTAGSLEIRIPSEHFETMMIAFKGLATVVQTESVSAQDVTEEYIDLQARLNNLKAEEFQYLTILEKATTVEELIEVHNALATVRSEIESMEGRIQYLENQVDYSWISVSVYEEASVIAPTRTWRPVVVIKEALQALVESGQWIVNGMIYILIFGIPLAALIWVGRFFFRRFHQK